MDKKSFPLKTQSYIANAMYIVITFIINANSNSNFVLLLSITFYPIAFYPITTQALTIMVIVNIVRSEGQKVLNLLQEVRSEDGFPHVKRTNLNKQPCHKRLPFVYEKPLSTDLSSARYLQEIAPGGGIVSFNYRYSPVISMIMRLRDEKKLGELRFFSAEFNRNSTLTRHHLTWRDSA